MLFELIIRTRNFLYDNGLRPVYEPPVPVIVVGNLVTGGTGKTPMVGWLADKLKKKYRVAVLSRGYKRKSSGFLVVETSSSPLLTGDEPLELKLRHPDILVAVDRHRTRGIKALTSGRFGKIDLILMDDGFQHRKIRPTLSIILDDYNRPMFREKMLPAGRLRQPLSSIRRAGILIITKVPPGVTPKELTPTRYREIIPTFYSRIHYQAPVNLFNLFTPKQLVLPGHSQAPADPLSERKPLILVTGIASPGPLQTHLEQFGQVLIHLKFGDHHHYTRADVGRIIHTFNQFKDKSPVIVTTGKDFVKLARYPELTGLPVYRIPAIPEFNREEELITLIENYVEPNQ
ncbi:MAG: tetraacyldisaccharide 4'-kinase [Bacteroidales bacterium]